MCHASWHRSKYLSRPERDGRAPCGGIGYHGMFELDFDFGISICV